MFESSHSESVGLSDNTSDDGTGKKINKVQILHHDTFSREFRLKQLPTFCIQFLFPAFSQCHFNPEGN